MAVQAPKTHEFFKNGNRVTPGGMPKDFGKFLEKGLEMIAALSRVANINAEQLLPGRRPRVRCRYRLGRPVNRRPVSINPSEMPTIASYRA